MFTAIAAGTFSACGGGIICDMFSMYDAEWRFRKPEVLRGPTLSAEKALVCCVVYYALRDPHGYLFGAWLTDPNFARAATSVLMIEISLLKHLFPDIHFTEVKIYTQHLEFENMHASSISTCFSVCPHTAVHRESVALLEPSWACRHISLRRKRARSWAQRSAVPGPFSITKQQSSANQTKFSGFVLRPRFLYTCKFPSPEAPCTADKAHLATNSPKLNCHVNFHKHHGLRQAKRPAVIGVWSHALSYLEQGEQGRDASNRR